MKRDERIAALARVPLFSGADRKTLRSVEAMLHERTFEADATMAEEGEQGVCFFVIESGEAEVSVGGKSVRRLGPGDHFGELALLNEGRRTSTVRALTNMRCFTIDGWDFKPLVKANPDLSWGSLGRACQASSGRRRDRAWRALALQPTSFGAAAGIVSTFAPSALNLLGQQESKILVVEPGSRGKFLES